MNFHQLTFLNNVVQIYQQVQISKFIPTTCLVHNFSLFLFSMLAVAIHFSKFSVLLSGTPR